jgi:hypothetical protein
MIARRAAGPGLAAAVDNEKRSGFSALVTAAAGLIQAADQASQRGSAPEAR